MPDKGVASKLLSVFFRDVEVIFAVSEIEISLGLLDIAGFAVVLSDTHVEVISEDAPVLVVWSLFSFEFNRVDGGTDEETAFVCLLSQCLS